MQQRKFKTGAVTQKPPKKLQTKSLYQSLWKNKKKKNKKKGGGEEKED